MKKRSPELALYILLPRTMMTPSTAVDVVAAAAAGSAATATSAAASAVSMRIAIRLLRTVRSRSRRGERVCLLVGWPPVRTVIAEVSARVSLVSGGAAVPD